MPTLRPALQSTTNHQPQSYISRSGHGSDGLRWAAMAAIHVLARMPGLVIEVASTQHELLSTHLSPSKIAIRNRRPILLSQNRTRCFLFLRSISTKSICTWFSLIGCCIYRWRNDFLDRQVLAAKSRDSNHKSHETESLHLAIITSALVLTSLRD